MLEEVIFQLMNFWINILLLNWKNLRERIHSSGLARRSLSKRLSSEMEQENFHQLEEGLLNHQIEDEVKSEGQKILALI